MAMSPTNGARFTYPPTMMPDPAERARISELGTERRLSARRTALIVGAMALAVYAGFLMLVGWGRA